MAYFPYSEYIHVENYGKVHYEDALKAWSSQVTDERLEKIRRVASNRTFHFSVLAENIYDIGNVNAVMRSCENFGLQSLHIIASKEVKTSQRVTQGAEKWIDLHPHDSVVNAVQEIKSKGMRIIATHLSSKATELPEIDLHSGPICFVLGNERDGVSQELLGHADENCIIPTVGMTQSFNISVAASILISHTFFKKKESPIDGEQLTLRQKKILEAEFLRRTIYCPERFL